MAAQRPIEILINAKDNASKVFDGLNAKLTTVAAAIAGYFGISAFANAITGAADFEEAMSKVQAATNSSGEELKQLKTAAEQAGLAGKVSSVAAANALENLAKAGLNGKEAIQALPAVMSMASAGGVDLADAAEKLTGVVMGMGLQFSESGRVADVLAKGANISRTSITGLAEAMSYAAPIAKTVGLSLESTVAIVGQFSNAGIDASRAGTALNSVLAQFSDPSSKFKQELLGLGIGTANFDDALKQLAAAGPLGASAIRAVGTEAGPAMMAALNLGIPALEELRKQLDGSKGSAEATAETMKNNLNGAIGDLSATWEAVKNVLGEPVLPVLKSGIDELAGALRAAVESGTIAAFGTALAKAFESAIAWVRAFAAEVDFTQLSVDLQGFAARTGEAFDQIGKYATNAGNIVKLVYGVMSSGTNVVLGAVYGIGAAFAGVTSNILSMLSVVQEFKARITLGDLSAEYKKSAEEMRQAAEATWAVSEAMGKKSKQAFVDVADGATMARAGFAGLNAESAKSAEALSKVAAEKDKTAKATETLVAALQKEIDSHFNGAAAIEKLREQYKQAVADNDWQKIVELQAQITEAMAKAGTASKEAATGAKAVGEANAGMAKELEKSSAAIEELKKQYAAAVASGDWQKAADLQVQINQALKDMPASGKGAVSASKEVAAAVEGMSKELKAAIEGTGLDLKQLTTGLGSVATSAITSTTTIIAGLEDLKKAGVDTGRILTASLSKAIDSADSEKALEIVKQKIEEVRGVLGNKIADGLLDQAKDKAKALKDELDKATPGINSVAEAMKTLGITSDAELKKIASTAKDAFDTMVNSGTASTRELSDGFKKAAEAAIDANKGIAPSWVTAQASLRGYSIATDEAGKQTLELASALDKSGNASRNAANAIDQNTSALERQNKEKERTIAALEKENELKQRQIDLYNAYWKMDAEHNSVGPDGKRIEVAGQTQQSLYNAAKDTGLTAGQAKDLADKYAPQKNATGYSQFDNNGFWSAVNELKQQNELNAERAESDKKNADKRQTLQDEQDKKYNAAIQKMGQAGGNVAPPSPAPVPVPRASPAPRPQNQGGGSASITPAPSYVQNITLPGVGSAKATFDSATEQQNMQRIIGALSASAGASQ